ncbi:MAG: hypothetical protein JNK49_14515 [Planctomycetes bacterium]|nr:hypothetical protein [Planctomycetota bacterium]
MLRVLRSSLSGCGWLSRMPFTLVSVLTAPLAVGLLIALAWLELRPQRAPLGPTCRAVVDKVVPAVLEDLQQARAGLRTLMVQPLQFDPTGEVTQTVRNAIERTNMVLMTNRTFGERLRALTNADQVGVPSFAAAIEAARAEGAMATLFGSVDRLELTDRGATIELSLQLARVDDGKLLLAKRYVEDLQPELLPVLAPAAGTADWPPVVRRLLLLALAVLLLPILAIGFLARMVAKRSNTANAFGLVVLGGAASLCAHLLVAPEFDPASAWAVTGSTFVIAALHTALVANLIASRRQHALDHSLATDGL